MKKVIILLITALLLVASSCSRDSDPAPPVGDPTETPIEEPATSIARYEDVPDGISPLTGLPYDGDGRAIIVQIENTPSARPQSAINKADLIYEMEAEDRITRLTAFFLSDYPEKVGPVRSARKQHMHLWSEWDYLYTFFGGSEHKPGQNIYEIMSELNITQPHLNGHKGDATFSRSPDRQAPHNAYTDLKSAVENHYDYTPQKRSIYFDEEADISGEPAAEVELAYRSNNSIRYVYNEGTGLYERFINGEPMIDNEDNEQVAVKNVIVQRANHYKVDGTVYTNIDLIGSGEAMYFTDGVVRTGTWKRESTDSLTRYYDESGQEIAFKPGVSFVQIVREDLDVEVK